LLLAIGQGTFDALPPASAAGFLRPRNPKPLRRQCELHAVVHSQLDPRVVEMGPRSLDDAGIPLDDVAAAIEHGALSLDFVDATGFERFAALTDETFRQLSERIGIPLKLLMVIREAIGMALPSPDDRLREDEMGIVPFIEL